MSLNEDFIGQNLEKYTYRHVGIILVDKNKHIDHDKNVKKNSKKPWHSPSTWA